MRKFDKLLFLNKFYYISIGHFSNKKIWICLKDIYGLNYSSSLNICYLFGISYFLSNKYLPLYDWINIYDFLKSIINFKLYDIKIRNIKHIRLIRSYRGWRHIFNLPTRGQRSHTNAKTRKKFKVY